MHLRPFHRLLALAILLVAAMQANAQPFPTKPLRLVVAFVPGGGLAAIKSLRPNAPVDPIRDFVWVSMVAGYPLVLVVHPLVPAKDLRELISLAKAKPGQLNYGSSGVGATPHLAAEYFKSAAGVEIVHVPYKGSTPVYADLMPGLVTIYFAVPASGAPYVKSGKLRAIAVTSAKRASLLPSVPTMAEAGLPGYDISSFYALLVPAGTPREIVNRLAEATARAVASPDLREKIVNAGSEPASSTPEELLQIVKDSAAKYERIIKAANIKPD